MTTTTTTITPNPQSRPVEEDDLRTDDTTVAKDTYARKDAASAPAPANALGLFMASLIKGDLTLASDSSHSPPEVITPPIVVNIVQDSAKGFQRSHSRSFRRVQQEHNHRRRAHAIDLKKISRWESYPRSQKEEKQWGEVKPQRRLSPTPTSTLDQDTTCAQERRYRTRDAIHRALEEVDKALDEEGGSFSSHNQHQQSSFTPCSSWLEVVTTHESYSPKPAPRCSINLSNSDVYLPARIPRKNSGEQAILLAASSKAGKAAKRTAALKRSGPPRRPTRQASLTDVKQAVLSLEEEGEEERDANNSTHSAPAVVYGGGAAAAVVSDTPAVISDTQRPRRHSDTSPHQHHPPPHHRHQHRHHNHRATSRHSIPPIPRGDRVQVVVKQNPEDDSIQEDHQEASSAEWNAICARSA